jgi:formiminoglutamase
MTNQSISQSQKRSLESIAPLFNSEKVGEADLLFLKSSTDVGVERNGGRNGARFAPKSFLSYFKKLNNSAVLWTKKFAEYEVAHEAEEKEDFQLAQASQSRKIANRIKENPNSFICHIGGGHDHIFPLLLALGESFKKVIVINIDAHADTRTDSLAHSGTPFRQFSNEFKGEFHLFQIGLLELANSQSTLEPLLKGKTSTLWRKDLYQSDKLISFFELIKNEIEQNTVVVFSLDADALSGEEVPGVSAVNGNGISREELRRLWSEYKNLPLSHRPVLGIYELNPVYDSISMLSIRTMANFLYDCLIR